MPKISEDKRQLKRQHLLQVAAELFAENGYNKTSVNDIVKMAKVSKGSFYTYFESKESLFFGIVYGEDEKIIHRGEDCTNDFGVESLERYIEYRLRRYVDEVNKASAKYTFEFWSSTTLTDEQICALKNRYSDFEADILIIVQLGQKHDYYRRELKAETFIQVLQATLDGLILYDSVLYRPISDEVIETTIDIMNCYLRNMRGRQ